MCFQAGSPLYCCMRWEHSTCLGSETRKPSIAVTSVPSLSLSNHCCQGKMGVGDREGRGRDPEHLHCGVYLSRSSFSTRSTGLLTRACCKPPAASALLPSVLSRDAYSGSLRPLWITEGEEPLCLCSPPLALVLARLSPLGCY